MCGAISNILSGGASGLLGTIFGEGGQAADGAAAPAANTPDGTPQAARKAAVNSGRNTQGGQGGAGSTMLTGSAGAAPNASTLGNTTLLGG